MDGQIDDDLTTIRIAVTVGSSDPYIQILSVGQLNGNMQFKMLGSVPRASHSLLLHGSDVIVALMNDDDAFPVVIEWTTGKTAVLCPVPLTDSPSYHDLKPHLPCCAAKYWNEFIVLVMTSEIQVYKKPDFASHGHSHCGSLISIHPIDLQYCDLPSTVDKAYFVDSDAMPMMPSYPLQSNDLSIRIFLQDRQSDLHILNLTLSMKKVPKLSLAKFSCCLAKDDGAYSFVDQVCIGSTGSMILLRHSEDYAAVCRMSIANLRNSTLPQDELVHKVDGPTIAIQNKAISVENLPNLQFHPWIDFDDARGVFVVGNSRGELFVGRFVDDSLLSTSSVLDDLPNISDATEIWPNQPVQMILPVFYSYSNLVKQCQIPLLQRQAATQFWGLIDGRPFSAPGWSSDWLRFENIGRWIVPHLRWGAVDPYFHFGDGGLICFDGNEAASAVLRYDHRILGNIYPVAYREDSHTDVIFRVGQRYYLQTECHGDDEWGILVYAVAHATLKSRDSLQPNDFGEYEAARLLDTYYGSPNSATVRQENQIHVYDNALQEAIFPAELESDRNPDTCSVEDGRIVIRE